MQTTIEYCLWPFIRTSVVQGLFANLFEIMTLADANVPCSANVRLILRGILSITLITLALLLNVGPISVKSVLELQTICVKVFSWVRLYQQIVNSSWDSLVASRALCFLCRSVGLSDLIPLMLLSPHSLQKPKATAWDTPLSVKWLVSQPCW